LLWFLFFFCFLFPFLFPDIICKNASNHFKQIPKLF
jgi:hypothetical protein